MTSQRLRLALLSRWLMGVAAVAALLLFPGPVRAQITPLSVPDLPATIPLFPLPNVGLLPFQQLPLRVVEPRYREMLTDALATEHVIGLIQLQPGFESDYQGRPPIFSIGCAAIVVRSEPRPDGEFDIIVRGFIKFHVLEEVSGKTYRLARVEPIAEPFDEDAQAKLHEMRPAVEAAIAASLGIEASTLRLPPMSDDELVNAAAMNIEFDTLDRQVLIEQRGVVARAQKLIEILERPPDDPLTGR